MPIHKKQAAMAYCIVIIYPKTFFLSWHLTRRSLIRSLQPVGLQGKRSGLKAIGLQWSHISSYDHTASNFPHKKQHQMSFRDFQQLRFCDDVAIVRETH